MLHRQTAFFIDRIDSDGVLFLAIPTAPQEPLVALASCRILHLIDVHRAALHTAGSIAPTLKFKELDGRRFVAARQGNVFNNRRFREIVPLLVHE